MTELLKMKVPGDPEYIQIAKMAAGSAASLEGFDIEKVEDIRMAVGEACKVITCHGSDCWSEYYQLSMEMKGDRLEISVADASGGVHNQTKKAKPCLDCPKEGDLGVHIIKTIMDEFEIDSKEKGYKSLRMVKCK